MIQQPRDDAGFIFEPLMAFDSHCREPLRTTGKEKSLDYSRDKIKL
jgi:hypothetical protein